MEQLNQGKFIKLKTAMKEPEANTKWKEATLTAEEIKTWKGNKGFICGSNNIRVIDIEGESKGNIYLNELSTALNKLNTFKVKTPSGGFHYYIKNEEQYSQAYWNITIAGTNCGEYRARDCYVVAPGSIVKEKKYEIINDAPIKEVPLEQIRQLLNINEKKQFATETTNGKDESNSGKEYKEICRLQSKAKKENGKTLTYEEINKEMQPFIKWTTAPEQYRKKTFEKATKFIEEIKQEEKEIKLKSLNLLEAKDIINTKSKKNYLVKDIIFPNTTTQIYGMPGCFKSLLALDLAISMANGKDWLNIKTKRSGVMFLDKENNRETIKERLIGLMKGKNIRRKKMPIVFLLKEGQLNDNNFVQQLAEEIKKRNIKAIFFDTLIRFSSGKENSAEDINALYQAFTRLQEKNDCCVIFLHHSDKSGTTYRGSSDLLGQTDATFKVIRKSMKENYFKMENVKNRSGEIADITGQVLIDEKTGIIKIERAAEKADQEAQENYDIFAFNRAFALNYAREQCPTELTTFNRAGLITEVEAWNSDNKDKQIAPRSMDRILQWLVKKRILVKADKRGEYYYKVTQNELISKWIADINEDIDKRRAK